MLKQSIGENISFQTSSSLKASFFLTTTTVNEAVREDWVWCSTVLGPGAESTEMTCSMPPQGVQNAGLSESPDRQGISGTQMANLTSMLMFTEGNDN